MTTSASDRVAGSPLARRSAFGTAVVILAAGIGLAYRAVPVPPFEPARQAGIGGVHAAQASHTVAGQVPDRPVTTVELLSCTPLPDIPGKALTMALVGFPPDAFTPAHRHPGTVSAYVLSGTLRSQLAGGLPVVYAPGQTWFEPPDVVHLFAENASTTEPASLLAIFISDEGCEQLVIPAAAETAAATRGDGS